MTVTIIGTNLEDGDIFINYKDMTIPLDRQNGDYITVINDIVDEGLTIDGDIPEQVVEDIAKVQLARYSEAVARLEQYEVSLGFEAVTEEVVVGQEVDEEAKEMVDVTETRVIFPGIAPVEATVDIVTYDEDGNAITTTIENPLITKDKEERAKAQAIIDATPQEVIDAYTAL